MEFLKIFLAAFLVDNVVFMRFLALCSYVGMSTDVKQSFGMGTAVTFVTVLATLVTWPLYHWVLAPLHMEFLQLLIFILVIAALVQLVEYYLKKNVPGLYAAMGIYLPLITTNCAILAVTLDTVTKGYGFLQSLVYALGVSLGYLLSMVMLAGVRERTAASPIPPFLKGTPILFVSTALLAVAFMGFGGLIR
jgi:electron transport complex protein RnfA